MPVLRLPHREVGLVAANGALGALVDLLTAACRLKPATMETADMCYRACVALHALATKHPPSCSSMVAEIGPGSWPAMLAALQQALPRKFRTMPEMVSALHMVSQAVGGAGMPRPGATAATAPRLAAAPSQEEAVAAADAAMAALLKVCGHPQVMRSHDCL